MKVLLKADKVKFDDKLGYYIGFNEDNKIYLDEYGNKKEFELVTKKEVLKKQKTVRLKNSLLRKIEQCAIEKGIGQTLLLENILKDFFESDKCKKIGY